MRENQVTFCELVTFSKKSSFSLKQTFYQSVNNVNTKVMKSRYEAGENLMKMFPDLSQHNQPEATYTAHGSWYCTKELIPEDKPAAKLNLNFRKNKKKRS